jgi:hypothetical protein
MGWTPFLMSTASLAGAPGGHSGRDHSFVTEELAPQEPRIPVGMVDIRPYKELFRADIGLFAPAFQGKGYGRPPSAAWSSGLHAWGWKIEACVRRQPD